jgi:glycosyltransferase involved in cell wall biosynthesis
VTLSEELGNELVDNYGISTDDIYILPQGVNTGEFTPKPKDGGIISFIYIGTIERRRGIDEFIEAIISLPEECQKQIEFHLYGLADEEFIEELEKAFNDSYSTFQWHGHVDHNKIPEILPLHDVGVSPLPPYDSYKVSSPAKVYEYIAAGLPVIASDIPEHKRVLNKKCGIIVDSNPIHYASAIKKIIQNKNRLSYMSEVARDEAEAHDWSNRFEELLKRLNSIKRSKQGS